MRLRNCFRISVSVFATALALSALPLQVLAQNKNFIRDSAKFTVDGRKVPNDSNLGPAPIERGDLGGVSYIFHFSDGSGSFGEWRLSCESDAMTDARSCSANQGDLWIFARPNGQPIVSVGAQHFPGSLVYLRVDGQKPLSTGSKNDGDFPAAQSKAILEKLKNGVTATTRFMEWPYREWEDNVVQLEGIGAAWQYMAWAIKQR